MDHCGTLEVNDRGTEQVSSTLPPCSDVLRKSGTTAKQSLQSVAQLAVTKVVHDGQWY